MYKAIPYIIKLHLCRNVDPRVNRVVQFSQSNARPQKTTYSPAGEPDPCEPKDPCPPPPKDDRAFWATMAVLFTTGCFGVYAKHNNEVRDWLSIHAPWFDDLIAVAYQENKTYFQHTMDLMKALEEAREKWMNPEKLCTEDGVPILPQPKKELKIDPFKVTCPPEEDEPRPCPKKKVVLENPMKDICEVEKCLLKTGDDCVNNFWTAKEACRYYNELVEENLTTLTLEKLEVLRPAMKERIALIHEHMRQACKAKDTLAELTRLLECGITGPKDVVENTKAMLREYNARVTVVEREYLWENDRSIILDEAWQKVEEYLKNYMDEIKTLEYGSTYEKNKAALKGDPDLLLIHTLRYKHLLEAELKAKAETMTERANRAVEVLYQDSKEKKDLEALIQKQFASRKAALDLSYKKRLDMVKKEYDLATQKASKELKETHERNMEKMLREKDEESVDRINDMVDAEVGEQKAKFDEELAEMAKKVKVVEDKLNARLKIERETKRSQMLYTAGISLLAATKKGAPKIRVDKEIKALEAAAGDDDKLVKSVLKAIPDGVRKEGVVPESVLRERYHLMEQTALSVALVEQDGSSMPVYIVSWLQSLFLFMKPPGIAQKDIDKPVKEQKELEDLDTFDILNLARYWVEKGCFKTALSYVDSLKGASRVAADQWLKDATNHLEIRQAAEAIMAHATAMSLQFV